MRGGLLNSLPFFVTFIYPPHPAPLPLRAREFFIPVILSGAKYLIVRDSSDFVLRMTYLSADLPPHPNHVLDYSGWRKVLNFPPPNECFTLPKIRSPPKGRGTYFSSLMREVGWVLMTLQPSPEFLSSLRSQRNSTLPQRWRGLFYPYIFDTQNKSGGSGMDIRHVY